MTTSHHCPVVLPLPDGLVRCNDGLVRPTWASHDELIRDYYDREWGLPVHDEVGVFECLVLEGFQAGLSWRTVLAKRNAFRAAFRGFIPDRVAAFDNADIERILTEPGIIRNRRKIEAAITNARATVRTVRRISVTSSGPTVLCRIRVPARRRRCPRSCRSRRLWPPT